MELGLQLYSVRKSLQENPLETLEQIAKIGYKNLELAIHNTGSDAHVAGMSGSEFRKVMDGLGMKAVSCHAMVDDVNLEVLLDFVEEVGSRTLIVPIAFYKDQREVLEYCGKLNRYAEKAKRRGLEFYYHNHFQEFQVFEGEKILDTLMANTDPSLVKFELDTYWTVRGGEDPVEWLRKLGPRCDLVHQKDLPATVKQVNYFDVFGRDTHYTIDILYKTQIPGEFAEAGEGVLDIPAYIKELRSIHAARYIFIEQDMTSRGGLESIAISFRNMTKLLEA